MDRMRYVAMTGAKETLRAQTVNNHNIANVSTTGFRADLAAFQSRAVDGSGYASRVYATNATTGWDEKSGALLSTGRDLDIAINGAGWIAVQDANGKEAYTRAGDWLVMLIVYAAAKFFDVFDAQVHALTGWIGGHALMHLALAGVAGQLAYRAASAASAVAEGDPAVRAQTSLNTAS